MVLGHRSGKWSIHGEPSMTGTKVDISNVEDYWDKKPVASEGILAEPGTVEFFAKFDAMREAEDCEPYAYSNSIHGYSTSSNKRVLDVGCGNGYVLSRYAQHGADVSGVDLTKTAIELSKKRFRLAGLEGKFNQIDGQRLPFPDNHFDIVCSMGVLHHISDPGPTVDEMFRVLKPKGKVIMMLYYRYSYKYMVLFRLKRLFDRRYRGFSQQQALNRNDGEDCPLAMVYSRSEAQKLMHKFSDHEFRLNQLNWRQLFLLSHERAATAEKLLGSPSDRWLARKFGWNLYITANKPG